MLPPRRAPSGGGLPGSQMRTPARPASNTMMSATAKGTINASQSSGHRSALDPASCQQPVRACLREHYQQRDQGGPQRRLPFRIVNTRSHGSDGGIREHDGRKELAQAEAQILAPQPRPPVIGHFVSLRVAQIERPDRPLPPRCCGDQGDQGAASIPSAGAACTNWGLLTYTRPSACASSRPLQRPLVDVGLDHCQWSRSVPRPRGAS